MSSFGMLTHGMPKDAVIDPHAARLLGVTFAIGSPNNIKALVSDPSVLSSARQQAQSKASGLSADAQEWLATGRQGTSSQTIFQRLTGTRLTQRESHPSDPDDFGRCRRLLDQVPEFRQRLGEMSDVSPIWSKLVAEWDELCVLMDKEAPDWRDGKGSAAKTYARMEEIGC